MKTNQQHIWQPTPPESTPEKLISNLKSTGSLTLLLSEQCGSPVIVRVLFEGITKISLNNIKQEGWLRCVLLNCYHEARLYAVTWIGFQTSEDKEAFINHQHPFSDLKQLGNQALGHWLIQQKDLTRSDFEYALTCAEDWQYWPDEIKADKKLPTRRSFIYRGGQSLLLTEVFL